MTTRLVGRESWTALRRAVRTASRPSLVAVAYFGQGAASMLPLRRGSRLVVDAGEGTVKSGQTCPAELAKLAKRGVRIYSVSNLHAKVFVLGSRAFVGSANVSGHSANDLVEAMIETTDRKVVSSAKRFVLDLCLTPLGPEAVARLQKMYRPPRFTGARRARRAGAGTAAPIGLPALRVAQLTMEDPPLGSEAFRESGQAAARRRLERPRLHRVGFFWWSGKCPFQTGDVVVQVLDEGGGRRMVSPAGNVLLTKVWRWGGRSTTFVYLEMPSKNRVELSRLAARLGRGAKKRLLRGGRVSRDFAERLLRAWTA
jgi:hypothetical protein